MPFYGLPPKSKTPRRSSSSQRVRYDQRDPFYLSSEWRKLRARYVAVHGEVCQGHEHDQSKPRSGEGVRFELDHLIERNDWPEGSLRFDNLILLCRACHAAKTIATTIRRNEHAYYTRIAARDDPSISTHPDDVSRHFVELERARIKRMAVLRSGDGRSDTT